MKKGVTKSKVVCEEIVDRIRAGESIVEICRDKHMPSDRSVNNWQQKDRDFFVEVQTAKTLRSGRLIEQGLAVLNVALKDYKNNVCSKCTSEMGRPDSKLIRELVQGFQSMAGMYDRRFSLKTQLEVSTPKDSGPLFVVEAATPKPGGSNGNS